MFEKIFKYEKENNSKKTPILFDILKIEEMTSKILNERTRLNL